MAEYERQRAEWQRTADQRIYHAAIPSVERGPSTRFDIKSTPQIKVVHFRDLSPEDQHEVEVQFQERMIENKLHFDAYGYPTYQHYTPSSHPHGTTYHVVLPWEWFRRKRRHAHRQK
jgi:hypothetical protein